MVCKAFGGKKPGKTQPRMNRRLAAPPLLSLSQKKTNPPAADRAPPPPPKRGARPSPRAALAVGAHPPRDLVVDANHRQALNHVESGLLGAFRAGFGPVGGEGALHDPGENQGEMLVDS